ncbi:hypothetical protein [Nannocystis sp. SCPEA4]|uniref:hypothetical protein n=1 Tax=Nannocystis sp. SCPEA4 TaxID=2996787 RepID=UPI0022711AEF|nr:hypothetical protein [Nannocystis sp. SCPEA4]MCY1062771.1 hypothetical protein [Nannocystis sp. SCPEA4]
MNPPSLSRAAAAIGVVVTRAVARNGTLGGAKSREFQEPIARNRSSGPFWTSQGLSRLTY